MTKRIDKALLLGRTNLTSVRKPHYFTLILWRSVFDMLNYLEVDEGTLAVTTFEPISVSPDTGLIEIPAKLGEVHFAVDHWNVNIVAHELLHALIHRMRLIWPSAQLIMRDEFEDAEEELAYEFGRWVERTFSWLWRLDPPRRQMADPTMRRYLPNVYWKSEIRMPSPDFFDDPVGTTQDEVDDMPVQGDLFADLEEC